MLPREVGVGMNSSARESAMSGPTEGIARFSYKHLPFT